MKKHIVVLGYCLLAILPAVAMTPTPKISSGKTARTSSGNAAYLVDNNFAGTGFNVSSNSWIAVNVGTGKSSVYFSWNNPSYTWSDVVSGSGSCKSTPSMPVNYTLQKSANSTNGSDGTWTTVATVTGNNVTARGHVVDFSGASWIKMSIASGGGQINEVEVFDLSTNGNDLWFFPGTSITANTYKGTPPSQNFADLIKQSYPSFTPMMVRGGIPCISSNQLKNDINLYLASAGNVKYWAIEMGTNDAWGGTNGGVNNFKSNMQTVITACKNAGIQPIIARMLSTNSSAAKWQVHPDYLTAIDDLTKQNNLTPGPDLYTYFLSHGNELTSDGVHPNAAGAASIQRLWAQKMGPLLYASSNPTPSVALTSPANNSSVCMGTSLTINATASISSGSISKVDFYDGTTLLGSDNSSPYSFTWSNPGAGAHTLRAISTSTQNVVSSEASVSLTVHASPAVEPYMQVNGGTWGPQTTVSLCEGENLGIGPHPVEATGWTWTGPNNFTASVREIQFPTVSAVQSGEYTAHYKDGNGCTGSAKITLAVKAKPKVTITRPANNALHTDANLTIEAEVAGTGVSNVQFYNGSTLMGQDANAPYSYSQNQVENGTYTLNVRATNTGGCSDTTTIKVTVSQLTGLETGTLFEGITCFPNPFSGSTSVNVLGSFSYSLYDVVGGELEKGSSENTVSLASELPSGTYLVKIQQGEKARLVRILKF